MLNGPHPIGRDPLVKRLLDLGAFSLLSGPSGTGKSFLALELAHCVATGRSFFGRRVQGGPVLYVNGSHATAGFPRRISALKRRYPAARSIPLRLCTGAIDFPLGSDESDDLGGLIAKVGAEEGAHVRLAVIDTLASTIAGTDIHRLLRALDRARSATGAHVMVVHHSAADTSEAENALFAAADTVLRVMGRALLVAKQRTLPGAERFDFALEAVPIAALSDKPMTSCVVVPRSSARKTEPLH